jgi:phosphoglycolate phosphatase-like HAD superfamily hydrolase
MSKLCRDEWVSSCQFHDLSQAQVLHEIHRRAQQSRGAGVVVFDLDSTLYEVGHRTIQIIREWVASDASGAFAKERERLSRLRVEELGYSLQDTFAALGLDSGDPGHRHLRAFWFERFFTNAYLQYDRPYPGAAEFVRRVHEAGARITYLTGRDEPNMRDGTVKNLIRDAFPWDERSELLMKDRFERADDEYKASAAERIRTRGEVIASLENEPKNLVLLQTILPEAMHVFVETVCSPHPALPARGLFRIRGFMLD